MAWNVPDSVFTVVFHTFLGNFEYLLAMSCSISLVVPVPPVAFCRWALLVFIGKSGAENSPGSPYGYSDSFEAFQLFTDASISDCVSNHFQSDDIVLGVPSSSAVMVSVVDERIRYRPGFCRSKFEYVSVATPPVAVRTSGGRAT